MFYVHTRISACFCFYCYFCSFVLRVEMYISRSRTDTTCARKNRLTVQRLQQLRKLIASVTIH